MMRVLSGLGIFALFLALVSAPATASLDLSGAVNVTVQDGIPNSTSTNLGWGGISGTDSAGEDQEVEDGNQTGQVWDFEAFLWDEDDSKLYLVAGYDFRTGDGTYDSRAPYDHRYSSGDVFLHSGGTDYVLDLDRVYNNYARLNLEIDQNGQGSYVLREGYTNTMDSFFSSNSSSDPYAYLSGATNTDDNNGAGYTYQYYAGVTDADLAAFGLVGGRHYILEFDLSSFTSLVSGGFTMEWTQECGNDKGQGSIPVPEPATIAMAFAGLLGVVTGRRRMKKYIG